MNPTSGLRVASVLGGGTALLAAALAGAPSSPAPLRYGRDIRPLLADRCFKCHGADAASREADLRLDERASATAPREGGAALVPGSADESQLWRRITSGDPSFRMPPPGSHKAPLTDGERALVRRWIEEGAVYETHWAFVKPERPPLPEVRGTAWPRNPIDRFVLSELERRGLDPSPEADRPTLLRRLMFDATGLPPTLEELDAFESDARPDAFERWVDRVLTEEPYRSRHAERLTAPWLDLARYADTSGIHTDAGRQIWPWRDWVLTAYRENMPFDRFVTEQIAGDLLPDATLAQKVASGFHRNHVTSDEGGAIPEEYLVEYAVDRVATTGSVFLGLTLGCARCHDHKFDPVSQAEYYGLYAYFNSIDEPGLYSQLPDSQRAFEPFLPVPSPAQAAERSALSDALDRARSALTEPVPGEDAAREASFTAVRAEAGIRWETLRGVAAASRGGAALTRLADDSFLASGANPDTDEHTFSLRTTATSLRLVALEALADPSLPGGRVGRAPNGNAVLTGVSAEAVSIADPTRRAAVRLVWAWADHEQANGDFRAVNVLDGHDKLGWAVQGHERPGNRVLLLLSAEPFGFDGGTELRVVLQYASPYAAHVLGRVRFSASPLADPGLTHLPLTHSDWYLAGPFQADSPEAAYTRAAGPELDKAIDVELNFGAGNQYWTHRRDFADGALHVLAEGVNSSYVGRRVYAPTARESDLSLGSDDGIRVFVNGEDVFSKRVDRPLAANQDRVRVAWRAGFNSIVLKIVNTGGKAGFFHERVVPEKELAGDLPGVLLTDLHPFADLQDRVVRQWRMRHSPAYRERVREVEQLQAKLAKLDTEIPLTMVMKELPEPRPAFVLTRGLYNLPDRSRPAPRSVPAALGRMPEGAPADRRGLAAWLVSPENPLVARVAVNRLWELCFGTGIVRTTEDFGLQGEWPSHPELLDWLAVEFREKGWDVREILRLILTSSTYRQSSRFRAESAQLDPDGRILSRFPRSRLTAEQLRDAALAASGLLVERFGGPSVKPYQPPGLWEEVAMPASNTRVYQRDDGERLYRRSLYTYWKRACPPPALMTLDAPTREFCTPRRSTTNTPLQALVLWNDEQFVEAARALAERALARRPSAADDRAALSDLFRRCASRRPTAEEVDAMEEALTWYRARFGGSPAEAVPLLSVGARPAARDVPAPELAAWTIVASAILSSDASLCKD